LKTFNLGSNNKLYYFLLELFSKLVDKLVYK